MLFLWHSCDIPMSFPCHFYGMPMSFLWYSYGISILCIHMALLFHSYDISYGIHTAFLLLLLLLLKKVGSVRLRESDVHPVSPKTTAPQYQPIDRKKRKGKIVEDYSRDRAA